MKKDWALMVVLPWILVLWAEKSFYLDAALCYVCDDACFRVRSESSGFGNV
jgi:hypothetical protein